MRMEEVMLLLDKPGRGGCDNPRWWQEEPRPAYRALCVVGDLCPRALDLGHSDLRITKSFEPIAVR